MPFAAWKFAGFLSFKKYQPIRKLKKKRKVHSNHGRRKQKATDALTCSWKNYLTDYGSTVDNLNESESVLKMWRRSTQKWRNHWLLIWSFSISCLDKKNYNSLGVNESHECQRNVNVIPGDCSQREKSFSATTPVNFKMKTKKRSWMLNCFPHSRKNDWLTDKTGMILILLLNQHKQMDRQMRLTRSEKLGLLV